MTGTRTFQSIAEIIVPETRSMEEAEWREFGAIIDGALARRPAAVRRQLGMFVRILNVMALVHEGRTLTRLDPERRAQFLRAVEASPILLFRRGLWGVRTLVYMGYYARAACAQQLGYAASARGWEARP